ncbi:hypothetical protein IPM19_03315 [bacterium]|nr:MAG: hypothetical protein IPM19_03315 [bacterium]
MKWLLYILIILLVVIIDQSVFNVFHLGSFTPDLLLLFTLAVVWSFNNFDFLIFAALGGFWMETMMGFPVGSLIVGLILVGSLAYLVINRWLYSEKPWQYFLGAIIFGTIIVHVWMWAYTGALFAFNWSEVVVTSGTMLRTLLPAMLLNILLTYPILIITELLAKLTQRSGGSFANLSINKKSSNYRL